jgi:hypothetical protein
MGGRGCGGVTLWLRALSSSKAKGGKSISEKTFPFFFETGSCYVARQAWTSGSACLNFWSAGIIRVYHYT